LITSFGSYQVELETLAYAFPASRVLSLEIEQRTFIILTCFTLGAFTRPEAAIKAVFHHRDAEFSEIGVFLYQELFTLRPSR
jgi:hypothetical protein